MDLSDCFEPAALPRCRCNACRDTGRILISDARGCTDWEWCRCPAAAPAKARMVRVALEHSEKLARKAGL